MIQGLMAVEGLVFAGVGGAGAWLGDSLKQDDTVPEVSGTE